MRLRLPFQPKLSERPTGRCWVCGAPRIIGARKVVTIVEEMRLGTTQWGLFWTQRYAVCSDACEAIVRLRS